jgi:hypothetical protein
MRAPAHAPATQAPSRQQHGAAGGAEGARPWVGGAAGCVALYRRLRRRRGGGEAGWAARTRHKERQEELRVRNGALEEQLAALRSAAVVATAAAAAAAEPGPRAPAHEPSSWVLRCRPQRLEVQRAV